MTAPTSPRAAALLAVLATALSPAGCKVDKPAFNEKIFGCNPNAADPACGTDVDNKLMACVPAYQLGGRNFCATGCDVNQEAPEGPTAICLPSGPKTAGPVSGAHLPRCNPGVENDCERAELSCLRTDLLVDEGVCTTVGSCRTDGDCRDPVRAKCMGELLRENYAGAELKADHTYCLQFGCRARRTACSPGETCLRDVLPQSSAPSDICVPNCDANRNCPPNYFCFPDLYSVPSPSVCIPGLLGLRCRSRLDCLFGDCIATKDLADAPAPESCAPPPPVGSPREAPYQPACDLGFNICTVPCNNDDDCSKFDSVYGTLFCSKKADGSGHCTGARAFRGAICGKDSDCLYPGEICGHAAPDITTGLCVQPCERATGVCPSYGGVPHVCRPQFGPTGIDLGGDPWICWPGYLGMPCAKDEHCIPSLSCQSENALIAIDKICTIKCASDDDCNANRFTAGGWCDPTFSICKAPLADDSPLCTRDSQCESKKCIVFGTGHKCDKTPGY